MGRHLVEYALIEWPVLGLAIFMVVFTAAVVRVFKSSPSQHLIGMPLEDDQIGYLQRKSRNHDRTK